MTESKNDYLLQLFQDQVDQGHDLRAAGILKLLNYTLPAAEIDKLRTEVLESPQRQRKKDIRKLIKKRGIKHLVHFTQAANVRSIFDHGLLPRQTLFKRLGNQPDAFQVNDPYRYDERLDANCLSISFPNYRMFRRYQKVNYLSYWVVLLLKPEILWQMDCAFCRTNASANSTRSTPLEELKSASALAALFENFQDGPTTIARSNLLIPKCFTTNPQAEALVFGVIPPQAITAVCLKRRDESYALYTSSWKGIPICVRPEFFAPRSDYDFWRN